MANPNSSGSSSGSSTGLGLRGFIAKLEKEKKLIRISKPVSPKLDAAGILHKLDGKGVLFEKIEGSEFQSVGNLFSSRDLVADYFGIKKEQLREKLVNALAHPTKPKLVATGPCLEVEMKEVDLEKIPIFTNAPEDGGAYIASGIVVTNDKQYGRNMSYHRMLRLGKNKITLRILKRHLNEYLERAGGQLDVAVIIGNAANIMLGASISTEIGTDELSIANALEPVETVKLENGIEVPADSEFVLQGTISTKETAKEGKFVDLTETYDIIRDQPVLTVKKITHRKGALYQALLPGGGEHKVLMGMPREPTMFAEVKKVCDVVDVFVTPGGCSWLHGVVKIRKKHNDDGKKAIDAAFLGHKSMKGVTIVDEDIDIYDPNSVEWAIATRFQADKDFVIKTKQKGSSLDPSADQMTYETTKWGIDATIDLDIAKQKGKEKFTKAVFKDVDLSKYGVKQ